MKRATVSVPPGRISRYGLEIGKVNDDEQRDDGGTDRDDIAHAEQSQGNQESEGRFRAIRCGAETIQAENWDALHRTDLLGALVASFDWLADNKVKDIHAE